MFVFPSLFLIPFKNHSFADVTHLFCLFQHDYHFNLRLISGSSLYDFIPLSFYSHQCLSAFTFQWSLHQLSITFYQQFFCLSPFCNFSCFSSNSFCIYFLAGNHSLKVSFATFSVFLSLPLIFFCSPFNIEHFNLLPFKQAQARTLFDCCPSMWNK